ncbi:MAG TPA: GNAT family protein [Nocardioides sp.]|nr:GNAT family protein [Nocardioides sp.]
MTDPLDDVDWPLRTERLAIRRATVDDLPAIWEYWQTEEVTAWVTSAPQSLEDYRSRVLDLDLLRLILVVELDGRVVGDLVLRVEDAWSQAEVRAAAHNVQAEVGYVLDPAVAGHGYATEAVTALIDACFTQLGLRRVRAQCFADNEPSWRLMERIGMRRETHSVKESLHRSGAWLDGFGYAVLAEEWRERQSARSMPPSTGTIAPET